LRLYDAAVFGKGRKRRSTGETTAEQRDVLDAMLGLSQTQILAQVTDEASLDSRTVGLLAFNGALLGGTLAAKSLLGYYWWTPFIGVALSTLPCLWSVFKKTSAFGPQALTFYKRFGADGLTSRTQLLADLHDTFGFNAERVKWKTWRLRFAIAALIVGLIAAALLIAVVRPTTIRPCAHEQIRVQVPGHPQSLCLPRRDFRSLAPAG
jgi:hypothetical protein